MDVRRAIFELYQLINDDHSPAHEVAATFILIAALLLIAAFYLLRLVFPYTKLPNLIDSTVEFFAVFTLSATDSGSIPGDFPDDQVIAVEDNADKIQAADQSLPSSSTNNADLEKKSEADELPQVINHQMKQEAEPQKKVGASKAQAPVNDGWAKARKALLDELVDTRYELEVTKEELEEMSEQKVLAATKQAEDSKIITRLQQEVVANQKLMAERQEEFYKLQDEVQQKDQAITNNNKASLELEKLRHKQQGLKYTEAQFQEAVARECATKEINASNEEVQRLQDQIESERTKHASEIQAIDAKLQSQDQELKSLHSAFNTQLEANRNADRQVLEEKAAEYQAEILQLRTQLSSHDPNLQNTISQLNEAIAQKDLQLSQQVERVDNTNSTIEQLKAQNVLLSTVGLENSQQIKDLQQRLDFSTTGMQKEIEDLRKGGRSMQGHFQEVERERDNYVNELQQARGQLANLQMQHRHQTEADPQSKKAYEQQIVSLRNDLEKQKAEQETLRKLHEAPESDLQEKVADLQREVRQEMVRRARAENHVNDLTKKLDVATKRADNLDRSNNNGLKGQTSPAGRIPKNLVSVQEMQKRIGEAETRLTQSHRQEAEQRLRDVKVQISSLEDSVSHQQATIETLQSQLSEMTKEKESFRYAADDRSREVQVKLQHIDELERHIQQRDNYEQAIHDGYAVKMQLLNTRIESLQTPPAASSGGLAQVAAATPAPKRDIDTVYEDDVMEGLREEERAQLRERQLEERKQALAEHKIKLTAVSRRAAAASSAIRVSTAPNPFAALTQEQPSSSSASAPPPPPPPPPQPYQEASTPHPADHPYQEVSVVEERRKRAAKTQTDEIDELFTGPEPDMALMVAQDEENARREEEKRADAELARLLTEEMYGTGNAPESREMYDA